MSAKNNDLSSEKKIINIGLIGVGCIAENHLLSLSLIENNRKIWGKNKRVKLTAICDINKDRIENILKVFPVKKTYTSVETLLKDPEIDAVYVLTPTKFHKELTIAAAEHGKHVFVEKPTALTPEEIDEMIAARDKYGVKIQTGLVFRSAPVIEYLKHYIKENAQKLGKPLNISFRDSQWKPYTGEDSHASTWRKNKDLAHAGILFEHTIHDIDGMSYIFGYPKEVYAKIRYIAGIEGIEDNVSAMLEFESGMIMNISANWHNIHHDQRRMELYFENAFFWVTVDDKAVTVKVKYLGEEEETLDMDITEKYYKDLIHKPDLKTEVTGPYYYESIRFFDSIFDDKPAYPSLEIGKKAQKIIEACYESSRKDQPIKLTLE